MACRRSVKDSLQAGEQFAFGAALKYLGNENPARFENFFGDGKGGLGERHDPQMVGRGVPGRGRRHVAQDDVGAAAERQFDRRSRLGIAQIHAQQASAGEWGRLGEVDAQHAPAHADALDCYLGPTAGCAAEVDDPAVRPQQAEALVELDQLESSTRSVALPARRGHIGIV